MIKLTLIIGLSGCSGIKLAYKHVDLLIRMQADRYIDMTAQQRQWFAGEIDGLHAWHRTTQLPKYARALRDFSARAQTGPIGATDVYRAEAMMRGWTQDLTEQFTPLAGRLLAQANDHQLAHLRKVLDEENQKTLDEARDLTVQELRDKTRKRLVDGYEMSLGVLDMRQLAAIDSAVAKLRPTMRQHAEYRRRWQRDMLELLARERKAPDCFVAGFAQMSRERAHWYAPDYRAAEASNEQVYRDLSVAILVSASLEQRRHLARKFNDWAVLLEDLTRQQNAGVVAATPLPKREGACTGTASAALGASPPDA